MSDQTELLACPFCSGPGVLWNEPNTRGGHDCCVACPACDFSLSAVLTESEAIAAWNRRVPTPVPSPGLDRATIEACARAQPLSDEEIVALIHKHFPWQSYPQVMAALTHEKSVPLFPQETYDVPNHGVIAFVRDIEARALAEPSEPSEPNDGGKSGGKPKVGIIRNCLSRKREAQENLMTSEYLGDNGREAPAMTITDKLAAVRAGLEGVTPGPWFTTGAPWFRTGDGVIVGSPDPHAGYLMADLDDGMNPRDEYAGHPLGDPDRDAAHIARLDPDTIREWLDYTDALAAENARLRELVGETAARDVLAERERQKSAEGWTAEHDDAHTHGEMAMAAACYAAPFAMATMEVPHHYEATGSARYADDSEPMTRPAGGMVAVPELWPNWDGMWWKPGNRRRMLVKAGALILAEIERLDRTALLTRLREATNGQ